MIDSKQYSVINFDTYERKGRKYLFYGSISAWFLWPTLSTCGLRDRRRVHLSTTL